MVLKGQFTENQNEKSESTSICSSFVLHNFFKTLRDYGLVVQIKRKFCHPISFHTVYIQLDTLVPLTQLVAHGFNYQETIH